MMQPIFNHYVCLEVSMMSSHLALAREGHLEQ